MDEIRLANYLKIPQWSIITITGILGIAVTLFVIFKYIPARQGLTFLLSGFIGGVLGFIIWFGGPGALVIP